MVNYFMGSLDIHTGLAFPVAGLSTADILTYHKGKNTVITDNINNGSVLFKCPGKF